MLQSSVVRSLRPGANAAVRRYLSFSAPLAFRGGRAETTPSPLAEALPQYQSPYATAYAVPSEPRDMDPSIKRPYERIIAMRKVCHIDSKGRHIKFHAWCLVGDRSGSCTMAHARSIVASKAVQAALRVARRTMVYYPLFENRTLYHDMDIKFRKSWIRVRPKPPGYSVRAQHTLYDVCNAIGIQDVAVKIMTGKTNPVTLTRAFLGAMRRQHRTPERVARARGLHLTDVSATRQFDRK